MRIMVRSGLAAVALCVLAACGGGGGGSARPINGGQNPGGGGSYTAGVFPASSSLAAQCVAPRAGTSDRTGSTFTEKMFLRSWTNELYLWYREVPDTNPGNFSVLDYFDLLKTPLTTPSNRDKDQFHFTFDTEEWEALSQSGVSVGYGAEFVLLAAAPPRRAVIGFVEPNTPAAAPATNLSRGMEIVLVDGVDLVNDNTQAGIDKLNAAMFPATVGESHTFRVRELSGGTRDVTMITADITHTPVLATSTIDQAGVKVGYIMFNDHIATAEAALVSAVNTLKTAGVQDLVLDLRYNGGGFLDIASELAFMIAGPGRAAGTFESLVFNDKNPNRNPVTGQPLTPTPFHNTTQGFGQLPSNQALPTLDLPRVYVLSGPNTCSASEAIINGLRGVNVEVFQIGSTTCGKPYGFFPQDNCSTTYFSIQFQGLNAQSFGDYPDGFGPQNVAGAKSVGLPGCSVADDFTHALGNPSEGRLAAALAFRASGNSNASCPAASGFAPGAQLKTGQQLSSADGRMLKIPARENRIMRH
jgi:carboxyl-terminal processing protease